MTNEEIEDKIKEVVKAGSKRFILRNANINALPESIGDLVEVEEISLIGNELSALPESFSKLTNLRRLHLSENEFEKFPTQLFGLTNLTHVCIRENNLNELPENFGELMHVNDIDLDSNRITSIPFTIDSIDIFDSLSLWDNPIIDPPMQILYQGKEALKTYIEKKGRVLLYTISLPEVILTPFKQYLISFPAFVKASKGKNIKLEVKSVSNGILVEVECETKEDLGNFEEYMSEYSGFVKQNVDEIEIKYEVEAFDAQKEMLLHQTKQEVQILKMKCDNIEFQNKYLTQEHEFMKNLVLELAKQQPILSFDIKQLQAANFENNVTTNITNDIEKLRDSILEITEIDELIDGNEDLLAEIKEELDQLTKMGEAQIKESGVFDKIKGFLTGAANLVKGADESFESVTSIIEKLSKISELIKPFL